jgi:hypothetical protein
VDATIPVQPAIRRLVGRRENPKRGGGRHAWGLRQLRLCRGTGELSRTTASNIEKARPVTPVIKVTVRALSTDLLGITDKTKAKICPADAAERSSELQAMWRRRAALSEGLFAERSGREMIFVASSATAVCYQETFARTTRDTGYMLTACTHGIEGGETDERQAGSITLRN